MLKSVWDLIAIRQKPSRKILISKNTKVKTISSSNDTNKKLRHIKSMSEQFNNQNEYMRHSVGCIKDLIWTTCVTS